jgi:hypothetical protein
MVSTGILPPRRETGNKSFEALSKFRGSRGNEARTEKQKTESGKRKQSEPPSTFARLRRNEHVGCHSSFYFTVSTMSNSMNVRWKPVTKIES